MSRAVANTLLPAARPASTIARPRPRELPVTNHTCAIHPPLSSHPPDILEKPLKLRIGCAMGIRKDLLVTEEIAESSGLRPTPFEFERAKSVEAALSILEGKWKIVILNRLFAQPVWRFFELEHACPRHLSTHAVATASNFWKSASWSSEQFIRSFHRKWITNSPSLEERSVLR